MGLHFHCTPTFTKYFLEKKGVSIAQRPQGVSLESGLFSFLSKSLSPAQMPEPCSGARSPEGAGQGTREEEEKERVKSVQVFQCDETRVEGLPRTGQVQNRKPQGSDKWTLL